MPKAKFTSPSDIEADSCPSGWQTVSPCIARVPDVHHGPGHGDAAPVQHAAAEDHGILPLHELSIGRQLVLGADITDKVSTLGAGLGQVPALGSAWEPYEGGNVEADSCPYHL